MYLDHGIQHGHSPAGASLGENARGTRVFPPAVLPVLIQVPAMHTPSRVSRQARRPSAAATERVREYAMHRGTLPPRRRLRKEIRQAGYGLLIAVPLALAVVLLRGAPATTTGDGARNEARASATGRPPSVSLSIEPAAAVAPGAETAFPVVLPGYLLPDDGNEEPAHAGG